MISGFPSGRGLIALPEREATLRLRIPAEHYRDVLSLAGKRLDIGGHQIRLGLPVARPLEPAPSLYARVVTIKKFTKAEPFIEAVNRKLDSFGVRGRVELPLSEPPAEAGGQLGLQREPVNAKLETQNSKLAARYRRRIVTIHGKSVVGFSDALRPTVRFVQRLSAITEYRDFSQLTFRNHIPVAQRLMRPTQNISTRDIQSTKKSMWEGEWDRETKITLELRAQRV